MRAVRLGRSRGSGRRAATGTGGVGGDGRRVHRQRDEMEDLLDVAAFGSGDYAEAERLYKQALQIQEQNGDDVDSINRCGRK